MHKFRGRLRSAPRPARSSCWCARGWRHAVAASATTAAPTEWTAPRPSPRRRETLESDIQRRGRAFGARAQLGSRKNFADTLVMDACCSGVFLSRWATLRLNSPSMRQRDPSPARRQRAIAPRIARLGRSRPWNPRLWPSACTQLTLRRQRHLVAKREIARPCRLVERAARVRGQPELARPLPKLAHLHSAHGLPRWAALCILLHKLKGSRHAPVRVVRRRLANRRRPAERRRQLKVDEFLMKQPIVV